MNLIKAVQATEILDSRGNPTLETIVVLDDGTTGKAAAPSGASLGKHEAIELRDNDPKRYNGMGVLKAVDNVNTVIGPKIIGLNSSSQAQIDNLMIKLDGSLDKHNLGANAVLSVSLAIAVASANSLKIPLYVYLNKLFGVDLPTTIEKMPTPTFNIINGGKHGAGNLDFQEFHIVPAISKPYHVALQIGEEIYQNLKKVLVYRQAIHSVGDEGGFAPNLFTNLDALAIILEAIKGLPYILGRDVFLGLDVAASHFKIGEGYLIKDRPARFSTEEFSDYLKELNNQYPLLLLEDPLEEDDWEGWKNLTASYGEGTLIVGDDLLVTNIQRVNQAIKEKACSAILVKPNQAGTLTETLNVIKVAREGHLAIIVSHRSGETVDTFIADLAVAVAAEYVKFGAPARGERIAKYNRLMEIEKELKLT